MRSRARTFYLRVQPVIPIAFIALLLAPLPFSTCISYQLFGVQCPGCGFTRALIRLVHGDFWASLRFHPLAIPVLALCTLGTALAWVLPDEHPFWNRFARIALHASAIAFWSVWVLRLTHVLPWD